MATNLIIVENLADWRLEYTNSIVITAHDYITEKEYINKKPIRIINLCRDYKYLSVGYYCSLLAEARGHKIIPSVKTILELGNRTLYQHGIPELEVFVPEQITGYLLTDEIEIEIFFGHTYEVQFRKLAAKIFEEFRCPLMRAKLQHQGKRWRIKFIHPFSLNTLRQDSREFFTQSLSEYTKQRWIAPKIKTAPRYDIAILHNPHEQMPPSDAKTLEKFIRIGKSMDISMELVQKKDFGHLYEYDALFIRETTGIDHHTFRFAKRAEREGMVVIDDPVSIFRCTNKVYLAELLKANKIKTPKTVIFDYNGLALAEQEIDYPIVLKIPDGSFSRGVYKVESFKELQQIGKKLLEESDIILAQEYLYTDFDWRIGILNRQPIFANQYYMLKKHWQIYKHGNDGKYKEGQDNAIPVGDVPPQVLETALKAANLIGDGLYGVDLKQRGDDVYVIEVNDNPSIDAGVEDAYLKDELYRIILNEFIRRLNNKWAG